MPSGSGGEVSPMRDDPSILWPPRSCVTYKGIKHRSPSPMSQGVLLYPKHRLTEPQFLLQGGEYGAPASCCSLGVVFDQGLT